MILKKVSVTNFRCFKEISVELHPHLNVFVGNNGNGKTAILDAVAIGLSRVITLLSKFRGVSLKETDRHIDNGLKTSFVQIQLETVDGIGWGVVNREAGFKSDFQQLGIKPLKAFLEKSIHDAETVSTLPVLAYYGSHRAVLETTIKRHLDKDFSRIEAFRNALEATNRFKEVLEWFDAMETDELKIRQREQSDYHLPVLQVVRQAITKMIPTFSNPYISTHPLHFMVTWDKGNGNREEFTLEQLSDGYRTLLALVMDLARRLAQANPHLDNPLQAEAIVLIDEIDLHLHPQWQQTILPDLLKTFKNTQFLVTTHSHQVLTTVQKEHIHLLDGEQVYEQLTNTYGAESSRLLEEIMNVPSRPESSVPEVSELKEYLRLVNHGNYDLPRATALRQKLEKVFCGGDSALRLADMVINKHKALRKKSHSV
jgi:predicted ATP-binding protein involved in virulence